MSSIVIGDDWFWVFGLGLVNVERDVSKEEQQSGLVGTGCPCYECPLYPSVWFSDGFVLLSRHGLFMCLVWLWEGRGRGVEEEERGRERERGEKCYSPGCPGIGCWYDLS